jgi:hypothetical protein
MSSIATSSSTCYLIHETSEMKRFSKCDGNTSAALLPVRVANGKCQ